MNQRQAISSAACAGCSSHGGCQVTSETKLVSRRRRPAMARAALSAASLSGARTERINSRALAKFCWKIFNPCTAGAPPGNKFKTSTSKRRRATPRPRGISNRRPKQQRADFIAIQNLRLEMNGNTDSGSWNDKTIADGDRRTVGVQLWIGFVQRLQSDAESPRDLPQGVACSDRVIGRQTRRQITLDHFTGSDVFQMPPAAGETAKRPVAPGTISFQTTREVKPDQPFGRFAGALINGVPRGELNLPARGGGLSHDQWQRRFGKLEKSAAVGMSGDQQVPRDFRGVLFRPPDGLALPDAPAGFPEVGGWQGQRRAAGV